MSDEQVAKILVWMPEELKADLDRIVAEKGDGWSRNRLIREACAEYCRRFFARRRLTNKTGGTFDGRNEAA